MCLPYNRKYLQNQIWLENKCFENTLSALEFSIDIDNDNNGNFAVKSISK